MCSKLSRAVASSTVVTANGAFPEAGREYRSKNADVLLCAFTDTQGY